MSQKTVKLVFAGTFLIALLGFVRVLSERNVWDRWSVTQTGAEVAEDRDENGKPGSKKEKKLILSGIKPKRNQQAKHFIYYERSTDTRVSINPLYSFTKFS